MYTVEIPLLN